MKKSLFIEFVSLLWPKLALYVTERERPKNRTYLHKEMMTKEYSADQKWEGTSANTTYVAADIVAMDSPLPIKKRSTLATSNGKLPKIGMKKILRETDINTINIMQAQLSMAASDTQRMEERSRIFQKILNDGDACSIGIDEKTEDVFLRGLSNGYVLIEDEDNIGTGLRIDYGYFADNCFGVNTKDTVAREDIQKVFDKADADGNAIVRVMLSKACCDAIRKEDWAKELVADYEGKVYDSDSKLPMPSQTKFQEAFQDEFGAELVTVNRSIIFEKNGKTHTEKPWNTNKLIFLCDENVGTLVWGTLAEATNPVNGVEYTTVDQHKLISRYSTSDPALQEITKGQALVLPVIENVEQIYTLDKSEAVEGDSSSGDEDEGTVVLPTSVYKSLISDPTNSYITINGKKYIKAEVATALTELGVEATATESDEDLITKINSLSDAKTKAFFKKIHEISE